MARVFYIVLLLLLLAGWGREKKAPEKIAYLKMEKEMYVKNEKIGFWVNADKDVKVYTRSCSCGYEDFYYQVYKRGKSKDHAVMYTDHSENEKTEKCTCKYGPATLVPSVVYYIDPIGNRGIYYLKITDTDSNVMISSDFAVR